MNEWDYWKHEYEPRTDIDECIYESLMEQIELSEFEEILASTNNWRAPGISGITYDFMKHNRNVMKGKLVDLMNSCLKTRKFPKDWLKGQIFPIPKKEDWGGDISITRPITLLECVRKCMLKILTKRLTKILKEYKVLKGYNFAALEGESCFEPIKILQSIIEDARLRKKECWVLMMDISKAYDSVLGFLLIKALERLKIPEGFVDIVEEIFYNRENRVMVQNDYTNFYEVEDGIDQGEVWSPILWRIFFEPLLDRLKKEDSWGYEIKAQEIININTGWTNIINEKINHLAFMDNANLISSSKENLVKLYNICNSFFRLSDIKANPKKYELLVIGNKIEDKEEENQVLLDGCSVKINNSEEGARFLGVWFSAQANFKSHNRIIEDCVKRLTNVMRWKKLTAKECIYLWNTVIIPVVEYQLQCTVLNKVLIEKLDSKIRSVIKQKCGLAAHTSNSVIHDKDFLGCKSVEALQKESLVKSILYCINHEGLLGKIMKIKIASIKEIIWFNGCIFNDIKHIFNNRKQIWLLERLKVLAEDNFKLCNHNRLHGHVVSGGHMSIDEMIDKNILSCSVKSLSLVNIMYITQLIDENNRLKTWRQVTAEAGRSSKGKIPNWFKELENKLMKNDQREVFACYELISEVYDLYNNNVILRDSWEKFNEIYIGREYDDLIEFDNRFKLIEKCFVGGQGFRLLEKEYLDLVDVNQSDLKIYTDGSKKEYVNGIGWVIFNGDKILSKGRLKIKGNYEVWELELVAIVAALMIVNKGSSVKIITDSKIVKDLWDKLVEVKNGIWSTRRIWNVKFSGIWKWVRYMVKYLDLNISVYKIKGHSGDLGNEMADSLSKLALRETEGSLITYLNIPEDMS
ncbi:hypothetical protein RirG_144880 [Rhizophagus irregularis DAOM 197198w]|uniref:Reverse transcriptase n=1 Tax=Rhizophagus irregularis (strain DAOM 197198w) TaxID=1432141 RepID=A0A015K9V1_RHIIW|nr:hypothetical protein RirG_144880 [Rhizophagus irregularis DAOM 197198w]